MTARRSASEDARSQLASGRNGRSAGTGEEGGMTRMERGNRDDWRSGERLGEPDDSPEVGRGAGWRGGKPRPAGVVVVLPTPPLEVDAVAVPRTVAMGVLPRFGQGKTWTARDGRREKDQRGEEAPEPRHSGYSPTRRPGQATGTSVLDTNPMPAASTRRCSREPEAVHTRPLSRPLWASPDGTRPIVRASSPRPRLPTQWSAGATSSEPA